MKNFVFAIVTFTSLSAFSNTLEERMVSIQDWSCPNKAKLNLGIYKLDKGCEVKLEEKKQVEFEGICRGIVTRKNGEKIDYKITFSTKANNTNLKYHALIKKGYILWNSDHDENPELSFYQPTWISHNNQRYVIVNRSKTESVMRGFETVVNIKSRDIDLAFIHGEFFQTNPTYKASILVDNSDGIHELENVTCDMML